MEPIKVKLLNSCGEVDVKFNKDGFYKSIFANKLIIDRESKQEDNIIIFKLYSYDGRLLSENEFNLFGKNVVGLNLNPDNKTIVFYYDDETIRTVDAASIFDFLYNYVDETTLKNTIIKLDNYLYSINYNKQQIDYQYALDYFKNHYFDVDLGACSTVYKDRLLGRNYDWYYSETASFVVKKEASNKNFASIGMASGSLGLTPEFIESRQWDDYYKILPYYLLDGINEYGLVASMNVVPSGDKGLTTGTHPELEGDSICLLMLPSYVLDHFKTADEAISWIVNEAKLYAPKKESGREELHFIIADKTNSYIVEFINNEAKITTSDKPYITNFYLDNISYNDDNTVNLNSVTPYGNGIERYNLITDKYNQIDSTLSMLQLMTELNYTHAYRTFPLDDWWKTDFADAYADKGYPFPNLTVTSPAIDYVNCGLVNWITTAFNNRTRDGQSTWQTVHTAVYDLDKKQLVLLTQEQNINTLKTFQLFPNIGDGNLIIQQNGVTLGDFTANQSIDTVITIPKIISTFAELEGSPYDNIQLKEALDNKQPVGDYAYTSDLEAEIEAREEADTILQTNINNTNKSLEDEIIRAKDAEKAITDVIAAIVGEDGILDQAKAYTDEKIGDLGDKTTVKAYVDGKVDDIDNAIDSLDERIQTLEEKKITKADLADALKTELEGKLDTTTYNNYIADRQLTDTEINVAVADAKAAGTNANTALEEYKTTNDAAVATNKKAIEDLSKEVNDAIDELETSLETEIFNREQSDESLQSQITDEVKNREDADKTLQDNIYAETQARITEHANINKNIADETSAREAADEDLQGQITQEISDREEAISTLTSEVEGKLDTSILTDISYSYTGDNVKTTKSYKNLNSGVTSSQDINLNLADSNTAGLMSPATVTAIQDLTNRVDGLEGQAKRLLYTEKSNPTKEEITQFVIDKGYTTNLSSIGVVVYSTKHIWHYYEEDGWVDDGLDTVNQFTNSLAGTILGSEIEGKVYAEDDGTGSVVGWDSLKTSISNIDEKVDTVEEILTKNIQDHIDDKNNPHEVTKVQVGLGNVDNTSDLNKPISTATQTALDKKTEKIELIYDGEKITRDAEELNFAQLLTLLKQTPDFVYLLHNGWVHLCKYIQDVPQEGVLRYIRFSSDFITNNNTTNSKNSLVYIESIDGIEITKISTSIVNNENTTYKASLVTEINKESTSYYPSIKALTAYAQPKGNYVTEAELASKQDKLTAENAGEGISITEEAGKVKISNTQTSAEWGKITGTLSSQTDLQSALDNKQNQIKIFFLGDDE